MPNKVTTLLIGTLAIILIGCGNASFEPVNYQCTISNDVIMCPDGTVAQLPVNGIDGRDGAPGIDGVDGQDGVDGSIVEVIDPCGDYIHNGNPDSAQSHDEVVLRFADGTILAWFKNVGFTVLREGVQYQTTDNQKCNFSIVSGEVMI